MLHPKKSQLIRLLPGSNLARDVQAFLVDRQARGLSPRTVQFYRDELRGLRQFLEGFGINDVQDLSAGHLRAFLLQLGKTRNPGGVHAAYRAMKAFLRWWEVETEPERWSNPIRKVHPPRVRQEPLAPIPLNDLRAMLNTCQRRTFIGDRDRAMMLALLDSGCRASEFVALNLGDVDIASGAVLVRSGKGGRFRTVFFGRRMKRALLRYLRHRPDTESEDPLWVTQDRARLTYGGLRSIVRRRSLRAGISTPSLHSFRRAFAILSLRSGADLVTLQRLLGHCDLSVLRRYLKQTKDDLRAAHEKHGPVDHAL